MMTTAVVDTLISRNPCQEKGGGVERASEMRIITPEQVAGIAAATDRRYRALVLTAAYAGCRWGELAGLRQMNLDLDDGTLVVAEQVVELHGGRLLVREPKSDAGHPLAQQGHDADRWIAAVHLRVPLVAHDRISKAQRDSRSRPPFDPSVSWPGVSWPLDRCRGPPGGVAVEPEAGPTADGGALRLGPASRLLRRSLRPIGLGRTGRRCP